MCPYGMEVEKGSQTDSRAVVDTYWSKQFGMSLPHGYFIATGYRMFMGFKEGNLM
jgi:hypothetical protein